MAQAPAEPWAAVTTEVYSALTSATRPHLRSFAAHVRDSGDASLLLRLREALIGCTLTHLDWAWPPSFLHDAVCDWLPASDMMDVCALVSSEWNRLGRQGWIAIHEDSPVRTRLRRFLAARGDSWLSRVSRVAFVGGAPEQLGGNSTAGIRSPRLCWRLAIR